MSNDNLEELNLKKSIDVLNRFYEDVKSKNLNINAIKVANDALIDQGKFAELMEGLREYINPNIFNNDEYIGTVAEKGGDINLNFHDSLKVFINFYNEVDKTGSFTTEELQPVWKALKHQFNLTNRLKDIGLEVTTEGVCTRRPKLPASLPAEP